MGPYLARRALHSALVLFLASVSIFFGVSAIGDPLGQLKVQANVSPATLNNLIARKHLDQPLCVQYVVWLGAVVGQGFGTTLLSDEPIWPRLSDALLNTTQLVVGAELVAVIVGIGVGVVSAKRQRSVVDTLGTFGSLFGYSVPIFWLALLLQVLITDFYTATGVRLFYTAGLSSPTRDVPFLIDRLQHLILPVIALSTASAAVFSRFMRASMLDTIHAPYVRTALAKGLHPLQVDFVHTFRNALLPVITVAETDIAKLFGGPIVVETIFGIPGMGRYFSRQPAAARRISADGLAAVDGRDSGHLQHGHRCPVCGDRSTYPCRLTVAFWRLYAQHRPAMVGLALFVVLVILGVGANWVTPYSYDVLSLSDANLPPTLSGGHLFGTDQVGRDYFTRVVFGLRTSLLSASLATAVSALLGVAIGASAGYFGGWVDELLMRFTDLALILPGLAVLMFLVGFVGGGSPVRVGVILGCLFWTVIARVVRAVFLSLREREFVDAGAGPAHFRGQRQNDHAVLLAVMPGVVIVLICLSSISLVKESAICWI